MNFKCDVNFKSDVNLKIQKFTQTDVMDSENSILEITSKGSLRCKPTKTTPRELYNYEAY
jgi:hypothetical protein